MDGKSIVWWWCVGSQVNAWVAVTCDVGTGVKKEQMTYFWVVVAPRMSLPTRRSTMPERLAESRSMLVGPPAL